MTLSVELQQTTADVGGAVSSCGGTADSIVAGSPEAIVVVVIATFPVVVVFVVVATAAVAVPHLLPN